MVERAAGDNVARQPVEAVVFDVGGVLIDWDPRHLYRKLFDDAAAMEHFLSEVCSQSWNEQADAGRPTAEITEELCRDHPDKRPLIESYYARFDEMIDGAYDDSIAIVERLHRQDVPLFVLSNFSAETFPLARRRFPVFDRFSGLVISGEEGMKKPDRRIYELLIERFGLAPARTLFIDDRADNTQAARAAGWQALRFTSAGQLARDLEAVGLLEPRPVH
ncbi:HAD family hydrolase [Pelagibius marinus]|uniref:HAD family hydrolase n=1 Tax=Pelagibius marinus TaxID=2762760 RepID=UPI0029CA345A|nr:HAD family phosphatase [Pelagibius marinus]